MNRLKSVPFGAVQNGTDVRLPFLNILSTGNLGQSTDQGHADQSAVTFTPYDSSHNKFLVGTNWVCGFVICKYRIGWPGPNRSGLQTRSPRENAGAGRNVRDHDPQKTTDLPDGADLCGVGTQVSSVLLSFRREGELGGGYSRVFDTSCGG